MTPETNKAILRRMIGQVWNERRVDLIEEFYTENVILHIAGVSAQSGSESVRRLVGTIASAYPELRQIIDDEIAEGDKVVHRWTVTSRQPGELNSTLTAGRRAILSGVTVFHLSNARVDELWLLTDNPLYLQPLGVSPPGGA